MALFGMRRWRITPTSIVLLIMLGNGMAWAQNLPDAGTVQRSLERNPDQPRARPTPATAPPAALPAQDKGLQVRVQGFVLQGNTLIETAALQALLGDLVGQTLRLHDLEQAAQRLADVYRARGWYVRVYLPEQDVTEGHIRLQVVEARYAGLQTEGQARLGLEARIRAQAERDLVLDAPLSAHRLEEGLLRANDLAGHRTVAVVTPGSQTGQSTIVLKIEPQPLLGADLALDNAGSKYTGADQLSLGLALNNPTGSGDQLTLRTLQTDNLHSLQAQYWLPLGLHGWRVGLHATDMQYQLGKDYAALHASGRAYGGGLDLRWSMLRSAQRNLSWVAKIAQRQYTDQSLGAPSQGRQVEARSLALHGDVQGAGSTHWGQLEWTNGYRHIDDVGSARSTDANGPRTQGAFDKINAQGNTLVPLGSGAAWQLLTHWSVQFAGGNLGTSEKFSLGGPSGVRAYPVNEASGDEGALVRIELQRPLASGWQLQLFYDFGAIEQNKKPWAGWQGSSSTPNRYDIAGAGLGLSWQGSTRYWLGRPRLSLSLASPLHDNPGNNANGRNSDGSPSNETRAWLTLSSSL